MNDDPKLSLKNKSYIGLSSDEICKSHFVTYGTKYISERDREKYILVDIGIAVYKKKDVSTSASNSIRRPRQSSNFSEERDEVFSTPSPKKARRTSNPSSNRYVAPNIIRAQVMQPVLRCKENIDKTSSTKPVGFVDIDFTDFVAKQKNVDCGGDNSVDQNSDVEDYEEDIMKDHIIEPFRQLLASKILSNEKRFSMYIERIGDQSTLFVSSKKRLQMSRID